MNTKPILIALILNFLLISAVSSEVKSVESHTRILKKADARAFLMKNLDLISNMDDRIFGVLIDSNLILPAERIKKMLKFNPEYKKTRKMWKQYFPGYYFIKKGDIQRIKIKQAYGPYDTKVRILTGGTSKKTGLEKIEWIIYASLCENSAYENHDMQGFFNKWKVVLGTIRMVSQF